MRPIVFGDDSENPEPLMYEHGQDVPSGNTLRMVLAILFVVLVLAMFPYTGDPTGDIKDLATSWGAVGLAVACLVASWRAGTPLRRPAILMPLLLAFFALNVIAALCSGHVALGLVEIRRYWSLLLLYFVASQLFHTRAQLDRFLVVMCGAVLVASVYGFFQKAGLDFFPWADRASDEYRHVPATFGNPNYAAHTLVLTIIMSLYLAAERGRRWMLVPTAAFCVHLALTHQRAGMLALLGAAALLAVAAHVHRRVESPAMAAALSLAVFGAVGVALALGFMGYARVRTGSAYPLDASLLLRYNSYYGAAQMIRERPILGYGPGAYPVESVPFWTPYEQEWFATKLKMNTHVHSDPLEVTVGAGLLAGALYLLVFAMAIGAALVAAFRASDTAARRAGFLFAALFAAFLLDGCWGFNLYVPVSAAILFTMAGALEGLYGARRDARVVHGGRLGLVGRAVVLAASLVVVVLDTGGFASEVCLQRGLRHAYRGRTEAAVPLLERSERLAPWSWEPALERGLLALAANQPAQAVERFNRALERNPHSVVTLVAMARARIALEVEAAVPTLLDDPSVSAAAYAARALALCPGYGPAEEMLGRADLVRAAKLTGRYGAPTGYEEQARQAWYAAQGHLGAAARASRENPSELYRLQARALVEFGDAAAAAEALEHAVQADPANDRAWDLFVQVADKTGDYASLDAILTRQIERMLKSEQFTGGTVADTYLLLARVREAADPANDDRVIEAYRAAVEKAPTNRAAWGRYGRFAMAHGRAKVFCSSVDTAQQRMADEGKTPAPELHAVHLLQSGDRADFEEAVDVLSAVVEEAAAARAETDLAWAVELANGRYDRLAQEADLPAQTTVDLGVLNARVDWHEKAEPLFAKAMPSLPAEQRSACAQHWARALMLLDQAERAARVLDDAMRQDPANVGLQIVMAKVNARLGREDAARAALSELAARADLDAETRGTVKHELSLLNAVRPQPIAPSPTATE
ncbi:MAG TPA: O-antigen ligase family protein [Candidatus Hydrogenedentes bacterium]|nr:O-antigen ligase family protein [Candidatus Hydrogenedentota bacterium]HPG67011.1 O-antigen ligase family protein [Candidatus Hydrogenedentota bacterium]